MRSSLVVRASDCQCTSCTGPGFDPSIRRHSGIWGAADEAVLHIVRKIKTKNPSQKISISYKKSYRYRYRGLKNISVSLLPLQRHTKFVRVTSLPFLMVNDSVALVTLMQRYQILSLLTAVTKTFKYPTIIWKIPNSFPSSRFFWPKLQRRLATLVPILLPLFSTIHLKQSVSVTSLLLVMVSAGLKRV